MKFVGKIRKQGGGFRSSNWRLEVWGRTWSCTPQIDHMQPTYPFGSLPSISNWIDANTSQKETTFQIIIHEISTIIGNKKGLLCHSSKLLFQGLLRVHLSTREFFWPSTCCISFHRWGLRYCNMYEEPKHIENRGGNLEGYQIYMNSIRSISP